MRAPTMQLSLAVKFVVSVVIILALTMGVSAALNYHWQKQQLEQALVTKTRALGHFVALISPEAILAYDYTALNDYMREIAAQEDNVYAILRSHDNAVLSAQINVRHLPQAASRLDLAATAALATQLQQRKDIISLHFPVEFQRKAHAKVSIGVTRAGIDALSSAALFRQLLGNAAIILVLSAYLYFIYRKHTLRPILNLISGTERVAAGDLTTELHESARDEIGSLTRTFNKMIYALRLSTVEKDQALVQLRELNKTLEARVDDRTAALATVNKELEYMALHDPLTALPNRALLQDRLRQALLSAYRDKKQLSVLMIDLDHFKEVNDTLGHNVGDTLLQQVAQRLRAQLRGVDTVARLGGDEFAVVLPATDTKGAGLVAEKLLHALAPPFSLDGNNLAVSGSIGIATFPQHGENGAVLMRGADIAMYVAKRTKNGYAVYASADDEHTPSRLSLVNDLRQAIAQNGLELYYQPKVTVKDIRAIGVEALARWQHPTLGFIPPDQFIPLAEQTGLIRPLTIWVLETAIAQCADLRRAGVNLTMAVNLSARNLQEADLPQRVRGLLDKYRLPPGELILEITESAVMADTPHASEVLNALHHMGVQLSIDDFGTGYSSLGHLRKFPIDEVKIDRSFIMDMVAHSESGVIVRAVIDLAHNLGLKVTGEGVESQEVLQVLEKLNCDTVQGYHLSRPMPAAQLKAWLFGAQKKAQA